MSEFLRLSSRMVQELLSEGKQVELVPRSNSKTPDLLLDGVSTELKTLSDFGRNTLKNAAQKASAQGDQILVDARKVSISEVDARQLTDFWAQFDYFSDMQMETQGRGNKLTLQEYYTKEHF